MEQTDDREVFVTFRTKKSAEVQETLYDIGSVVFGKWRITELIGKGGFGRVFKIERSDGLISESSALKVITIPQDEEEFQNLRANGMSTSQAKKYLEGMANNVVREISIMSKLKATANIVSYEDCEKIPHTNRSGWDILIRMELLHPLLTYVYEHPFSHRDIIKLGIDICKALELCQKYNIIHRDIKPENIFVSENGDFKLGDFGISRFFEHTAAASTRIGTCNYMAPEVFRGEKYGFSVDTYSLGIVLYRLLNKNRLPFLPAAPQGFLPSDQEVAFARRIAGEPIPLPHYSQGRLPEVVLKACAPDAKDRYDSPAQMRQALEAIHEDLSDSEFIFPDGDTLENLRDFYAAQEKIQLSEKVQSPAEFTQTELMDEMIDGQSKDEPECGQTGESENADEEEPNDTFPDWAGWQRNKKRTIAVICIAAATVGIFSFLLHLYKLYGDSASKQPASTSPSYDGWRYGDPNDYSDDEKPYDPVLEVTDTNPEGEFAIWEPGRSLDISLTPADGLELPVAGATGYASVELFLWRDLPASDVCKVTSSPTVRTASVSETLYPGTAFMIIQESGDWWQVRTESRGSTGGEVGWVEHRYCFINLPDVIPSMIYNDTNSDSSVFMTSYTEIPGVTGMPLYNQSAKKYNPRLERDEYMMPVLYTMAKKVCQAQQNALSAGNTIVLYEGYRPYDTQMEVMNAVQGLATVNSKVQAGISTYPWSISWFIATDISNHQQGYAIDVSLAKVYKSHIETIDGYEYVQVDEYQEYFMPTPIHELSMLACIYTAPVDTYSDAWQSSTMSAAMAQNEPAKALQGYCTMAGLTPLASKWWHFNDLDSYLETSARRSVGDFDISDCYCMSLVLSLVSG